MDIMIVNVINVQHKSVYRCSINKLSSVFYFSMVDNCLLKLVIMEMGVQSRLLGSASTRGKLGVGYGIASDDLPIARVV